jgi:hypothetical protein
MYVPRVGVIKVRSFDKKMWKEDMTWEKWA